MNRLPLPPEEMIDEALNSYDPEPLPPDFVSQVMSRLKPTVLAPGQIRFRLDVLDIAIPYFAASFMVVLLFLLRNWERLAGTNLVEPTTFSNALNNFEPGTLILIGLIACVEMFIAGAVIIWLWVDRPGKEAGLTT